MSHYLIGIVVSASDEQEARNGAESALNDHVTAEPSYFDYGDLVSESLDGDGWTFEDGAQEQIPAIMEADSEQGKRFLALMVEWERGAFMEDIARLRRGLARYTDERLWEGAPKSEDSDEGDSALWVRYRAACVGASEDPHPHITLYDGSGAGIRTATALREAMTANPGEKVYLAAVSVHG